MNSECINNMIETAERIGHALNTMCENCRDVEHEGWYVHPIGYVCQDCWEILICYDLMTENKKEEKNV